MTTSLNNEVRATEPGARRTSSQSITGWHIVAAQECRDLWVSGRGPLLLFAFSVLLSVVTYLAATNQVLELVGQRDAVNLTLQVAVAVGVLLTLVVSADAISGERERGTMESLLLAPLSRGAIVLGKLVAAVSLWLATFVVSVPYVWVLSHGVSVVGTALLLGFVIGTLLAVAMAAVGLIISALSNSNRVSLSVSLFLLLALFVPTQLPGMTTSWAGNFFVRINPIASGMRYIQAMLLKAHSWTQDLSYLVSPVLVVIIANAVVIVAGPRIVRLTGGGNTG
jgi:ABC-2 type transport system permease protein